MKEGSVPIGNYQVVLSIMDIVRENVDMKAGRMRTGQCSCLSQANYGCHTSTDSLVVLVPQLERMAPAELSNTSAYRKSTLLRLFLMGI